MNLNSIEGLTNEQINELFEDVIDEEKNNISAYHCYHYCEGKSFCHYGAVYTGGAYGCFWYKLYNATDGISWDVYINHCGGMQHFCEPVGKYHP